MICNVFKVNGKKDIGGLLLGIILVEGTGVISGFMGMFNSNTYMKFNKPAFSPPSWVFPVVWVILYLLMAIAAYRICLKGKQLENVTKALILYGVQLFLNFLWAIIFFRFDLYGVAFFELLLLLALVLMTTFEFNKIDKTSSYLMIPYIFWLSFAGILNYTIWMLNR